LLLDIVITYLFPSIKKYKYEVLFVLNNKNKCINNDIGTIIFPKIVLYQ